MLDSRKVCHKLDDQFIDANSIIHSMRFGTISSGAEELVRDIAHIGPIRNTGPIHADALFLALHMTILNGIRCY